MMSCKFPSFSDLGKDCRDLFTKGYHVGFFKINVKNLTCHGVEVKTNAAQNMDDKSTTADVEIKANKYPMNGLSTTHKWDTENNVVNEVNFQNLIPGGKVSLQSRFNGESGNKGGAMSLQYGHPKFTLDLKGDGGDDSNAVVGGSLVAGCNNFLAGYKVNYDTSSGELTANNLAVAFQAKDYSLLLAYDNLSQLNGYYFHRVARDVEVGSQCTILGGEGTQLSIGGKHIFGHGHALRAKVDSKSMMGIGLELRITPGFQAAASTDIDLKNFNGGNHKIGFGLEFGA